MKNKIYTCQVSLHILESPIRAIWRFPQLRILARVSFHVFRLCPQICILKKKFAHSTCAPRIACASKTARAPRIARESCGTRCRMVSLLFPPAKPVNNERQSNFWLHHFLTILPNYSFWKMAIFAGFPNRVIFCLGVFQWVSFCIE